MVSEDRSGWSFATARVPINFGVTVEPGTPAIEHAGGEGSTLCGRWGAGFVTYLHYFQLDGALSCPECVRLAAAWPTQPCGQERLYDRVRTARPGTLRDELTSALQRGAEIKFWVTGPAVSMGKHYLYPEWIVEGRDEVTGAFVGHDDMIGLARVLVEPWMYVIVLPADEAPLIARAGADHAWSLPIISQEEYEAKYAAKPAS